MVRYDLSEIEILVVDGNGRMLDLLEDVLTALGVRRVHRESDPIRALAAFDANTIDLVLTEWNLEPLGGRELVKRLRDGERRGDWKVPILLLTDQSDRATVQQARDAGVTEFLAKPFTAAGLYERLITMIEQPRAFVAAESYRGPDRRRRDGAGYDGPDRRRRGGRNAARRPAETPA